jgi:hypothetical protein
MLCFLFFRRVACRISSENLFCGKCVGKEKRNRLPPNVKRERPINIAKTILPRLFRNGDFRSALESAPRSVGRTPVQLEFAI